jgi:hypothetical protein
MTTIITRTEEGKPIPLRGRSELEANAFEDRIRDINIELRSWADDVAKGRHERDGGVTRHYVTQLEAERQTLEASLAGREERAKAEDPDGDMERQVEERMAQFDAAMHTTSRTGIPSLVPSEAEIRGIRDAIVNRQPYTVETRATVNLAAVGGERFRPDGRPVPEPRRIATAVGMPTQRVPMRGISGEKYGLEAVAAPTAEGGTKPEYDAITQVNLVPQAFGRWTDITEQAVEAMGGINDLVAAHARQIALDEDSYLVGLMVTEAGTAQAFIADVQANVRTAIATIESTVAAKADIIVVNPANYALLAPTTPANAGDVASSLVSFSGALLYPSAAVPTGFVLVAALAAVAKYVTATDLRTTVQPAVKTNLATVRTEIFADYGFLVAGGVRSVDVVTPQGRGPPRLTGWGGAGASDREPGRRFSRCEPLSASVWLGRPRPRPRRQGRTGGVRPTEPRSARGHWAAIDPTFRSPFVVVHRPRRPVRYKHLPGATVDLYVHSRGCAVAPGYPAPSPITPRTPRVKRPFSAPPDAGRALRASPSGGAFSVQGGGVVSP